MFHLYLESIKIFMNYKSIIIFYILFINYIICLISNLLAIYKFKCKFSLKIKKMTYFSIDLRNNYILIVQYNNNKYLNKFYYVNKLLYTLILKKNVILYFALF